MLRWIKISYINPLKKSFPNNVQTPNRCLISQLYSAGPGKYITIASYYHPYPEKVYHLAREALLQGGPIPAYLYADSGFMAYSGGIYTHGCDSSANHAITVVGYGPDYWNCCLVRGTPRQSMGDMLGISWIIWIKLITTSRWLVIWYDLSR